MGCSPSKNSAACEQHLGILTDDSIHAMLKREKRHAKAHGDTHAFSYRPRAPHPLLQSRGVMAPQDEQHEAHTIAVSDACSEFSFVDADYLVNNNDAEASLERLLLHAKHHCDTIDALDLPRSSQRVIRGVIR